MVAILVNQRNVEDVRKWDQEGRNVQDYCLGFMFDITGRAVVLIRKRRPVWQRGKWNGVGGHVEDGESAIQAMTREFLEETGMATPIDVWTHVAVLRGQGPDGEFRLHIFSSFCGVCNVKTTTDEEVSRFLVSQLPPDAISNLTWLIPLCLDSGTRKPVLIGYLTGESHGEIKT